MVGIDQSGSTSPWSNMVNPCPYGRLFAPKEPIPFEMEKPLFPEEKKIPERQIWKMLNRRRKN
jgi:hypothetical protein